MPLLTHLGLTGVRKNLRVSPRRTVGGKLRKNHFEKKRDFAPRELNIKKAWRTFQKTVLTKRSQKRVEKE